MGKTKIFQQYIWLVTTILKAEKITLKDLNQRWMRNQSLSDGVEMHRNTFNRHKEAIQEIFDINIECDKKDGFKYYIENPEVLREDSISNWMLSSITVHTAVQESVTLQKRILLEDIPSGQEFLQPILEAMKANRCISFTYQKYSDCEIKSHPHAEPYCLKLYKQRWYLLVKTEEKFRIFSLDRIKSLTLLEETFQLVPDFDAETHFRDWYGVYRTDHDHPQKVVLRAFGTERFYLRDLPLHHSQKEIATYAEYSDFTYYLCPTDDFIGEILRKSYRLKVLEPQTLKDKICEILDKMKGNYQ